MLMITEYCSHGDLLNFLRTHAPDFMASMITVDEVGDEVFYKNLTGQQERLRRSEVICSLRGFQLDLSVGDRFQGGLTSTEISDRLESGRQNSQDVG